MRCNLCRGSGGMEIIMEKKLFSIGEIAKSVGITRKIILNYEDRGLIKPDVKKSGAGNRFYTIDTFIQIRTIRIFQKLGFSLDEIRSYFDGTTDLYSLIGRLEAMRDEIDLNIERLYERTGRKGERVREIVIDSQTVYRQTSNAESIEDKAEFLRSAALRAMRAYGTDTTKRMYYTEYEIASSDETAYCVAVPPESSGLIVVKIPKTRAICICHHGGYEELPAVCEELVAYAREKGIEIAGTCRHIYIEGPPQHKDKSKYITQVALPLAEK